MGTVDLVVVGSGGAGLTAAVTAAAQGADVVLLESGDTTGGTYAYSTGIVWMPANRHAAERGIADSAGEARTLIEQLSGDKHDPALLTTFLERGNEALEFLEGRGVPFELVPNSADNLPDRSGGKTEGRALATPVFEPAVHLPDAWRHRAHPSPYFPGLPASLVEIQSWGGYATAGSWDQDLLRRRSDAGVMAFGAATTGFALAAALRGGVDVQVNARVTDLLTEVSGRVTGVAVDIDGASQHIHASRGVVLAAGGYDHSTLLQRRLDPHPVVAGLGYRGVDGDLFAKALSLGAGFVNHGGQILSPVVPRLDGAGGHMFFAREIAFPGGIVVNARGQRFTDDSFTWGLSKAMGSFDHQGGGYANSPAYFVFDHEWKMRYRLVGVAPGEVPDWLPTGDTPEGLADVLGIDGAALATTIKTFNADAERGLDPAFGRGSTGYARTAGDASVQPNPCVRSLEAPLYGMRLEIGSMGTLSGLLVDTDAAVLRHDGSRIDGLYAGGNTMASLVEGLFYSGGMANARGVVFGYLTALAATRA